MNNQLIQKVIKTNDTSPCPDLLYENPLIDRNVTSALARSFVKILRVSQRDSNLNTNLRHSVLENIRKLCRIEPENHLEVDENFTKTLSQLYVDKLRDPSDKSLKSYLDRHLDAFLVRKMKDVDISSNDQRPVNPEVAQSLLNLNEKNCCSEAVSKSVLCWDMSDKKNLVLVKNLWNNIDLEISARDTKICDISIKIKSEIEQLLLNLCFRLLTEPNLQADELFTVNETLKDLIKKCSLSSVCYQMCYSILNQVLIQTRFNSDILSFVSKFVENVKTNCKDSISILYPAHIGFLIILLDISLDSIQGVIREKYILRTITQLKMCHETSETDLILVLSHFPQWFHVYFA